MTFFGSKKPASYLGVDLGVSSIKLTELSVDKKRPKLMTYAYSERGLSEQNKPMIDEPQKTAALLVKMTKKAGTTTTKAISGLPQHAVFSSVISVPKVKDENQFRTLINSQVAKLTPLPFEEMVLDSKVVDLSITEDQSSAPKNVGEKKKAENVHVLVSGAPRVIVQRYIEVFKLAKLDLIALETESFALIRSLVGRDHSTIMILDIGTRRSNVTIVEKGVPVLSRSVNVGGAMLTDGIANQMKISKEEAEQLKIDLSKSSEENEIPPVVEMVLHPILTEMNYSISEYQKLEGQAKKIDKMIVTGGSAQIPGISLFFSAKLNMNTYIGDPWARMIVPEALRPVLDEIGPRMSVSIGLAMRDVE